MDIHRV